MSIERGASYKDGGPYAQVVDARNELGEDDTKRFRGGRYGPLWAVEIPGERWVTCFTDQRHARIVVGMINEGAGS